jgi:hypothetical protein
MQSGCTMAIAVHLSNRKHRLLPIYAGVRPRNWKFVALEKRQVWGTEHY